MRNTPEPWKLSGNRLIGADSSTIGFFREIYSEDSDRILACVNACAGIPTESLRDFAKIVQETVRLQKGKK